MLSASVDQLSSVVLSVSLILLCRIGNSQWSLHRLHSLIFHDFFRATFTTNLLSNGNNLYFSYLIFSIFMSISVAVTRTIRSEMTEEESRVGILKELELEVDDFRKHTAPLIPAPVATLGD